MRGRSSRVDAAPGNGSRWAGAGNGMAPRLQAVERSCCRVSPAPIGLLDDGKLHDVNVLDMLLYLTRRHSRSHWAPTVTSRIYATIVGAVVLLAIDPDGGAAEAGGRSRHKRSEKEFSHGPEEPKALVRTARTFNV